MSLSPKQSKTSFESEAALCQAFIAALPAEWTAYAETGGFDILLVRKGDGFQIGVEAKLKLNAKVILQAAEDTSSYSAVRPGPDCRAVLVPHKASSDLSGVCNLIGITVIQMCDLASEKGWYRTSLFHPCLPKFGNASWEHSEWYERAPNKRLNLPDYVPDVEAGHKSPLALTHWKISAIKIAILLDRHGYVTRQDFKSLGVSISRWIDPWTGWLEKTDKNVWAKGRRLPDFRAQHPVNYQQIEDDYDKWSKKLEPKEPPQQLLPIQKSDEG